MDESDPGESADVFFADSTFRYDFVKLSYTVARNVSETNRNRA